MLFCQNWNICQQSEGREISTDELARIMLELQGKGCENINLVTPGHVAAQVLDALVVAARQGLRLTLVHNSGGYDSPEALALLNGVIDISCPT